MYFHKNFLNGQILIVFFSLFLIVQTIVETGLSQYEIFAQTNNQSQGQQSDGIGSIEELEKLTAPSNDTSNNTSLMGGLEKSQSEDVIGGEQDVKFEGQQGNQTQAQGQQGNQTQAQGQQGNQTQAQGQQGNQTDDKGILEKLGEAVGIS